MFNAISLLSYIIYSLPLLLISGPFLSDLAISILAFYMIYLFLKEKKTIINIKLIQLFLIFWLIILASAIFSNFFLETYKSSVFYFRFILFSFAVAFVSIQNKNFNKLLMLSFLTTLYLLLIYAFLQYIFLSIPFFKDTLVDSSRITSLFGDEKIMGGYLVHLMPIVIYLMIKNNLKIRYILLFYCLSSIGIFISGERTAVLLFSVMTFLFLFFLKINLRLKIIIFLSLLFIFLIVLSYSDILKNRLLEQTLFDMIEFDQYGNKKFYLFSKGHSLLYSTSLEMFYHNNILGVGPKVFRYLCSDPIYFKTLDNLNGCSTHPHNYYIQMLAELGILGFIFLLSIFSFFCFKLFKLNKNQTIDNAKLSILISMIISLFPFSPDGNFF